MPGGPDSARTTSTSEPPPPLSSPRTVSSSDTGGGFTAGSHVPTVETLRKTIASQNDGTQGASESAGPPAAAPAPPPRKSVLHRSLRLAVDDVEGARNTESRGKMLTKILAKRMRQAHTVKNMLEELHVEETLGSAMPVSDEGLLEAAVTLVGDNAQVPVLQGYDPNTLDTPLHYGDTVALLVDHLNAVVAFAGAQDGRPWIEELDARVGMPPNSEACQWRLEPASRHDMLSKLKRFLKETTWDEGRGLAIPNLADSHADLDLQVETFIEANRLSSELSTGPVRRLFEILAIIGDERETNAAEEGRLRGKEIKYGNAVDLVHVLTGTRITMTKQRAIEHGAKKVGMDEHGTSLSCFVMHPAYRTYNDGSVVASGDLVQFETRKKVAGTSYFLHMSNSQALADDPEIIRRQMMNSHPYIIRGQELNATATAPSFFRVLLFRSWKQTFQNGGVLRSDDVFTFYHKQLGAYLHYDTEISAKPFLYESKRTSERERKKSQWYWKVQSCQLKGGGNGIPVQEHSKLRYRIKHVVTEKYLAQRGHEIYVTDDFYDPACLFFFRPFSKSATFDVYKSGDQVFLRGGDGEYLTQAEGGGQNTFGEPLQSTKQSKATSRRVHHIRMKGMDFLPDSEAFVVTPVRPSSLQGVTEVRMLIKVLEDIKEQLELLPDRAPKKVNVDEAMHASQLRIATARLSSTDFLDKTIDGVGSEGVMEIFQNCAEAVECVLRKLVINLTHGDDLNPMSREGPPNRLLQKILRELKAIPLVMQIIQLPFQKGVDIDDLHGNEFYRPLVETSNLLYRLLKQVVKGNITNAKILLAFLPGIRRQLGKGILITPTIKEIFLDKRELLNQISRDMIDEFVDLLKQDKGPQYIDFFSAICTSGPDSNPEPVAGVQTMIAEALLKQNPELLPTVTIKLYRDQEQTQTTQVRGERVTMRGFLRKRGQINAKFQERYFVLEAGILKYYRIPSGIAPDSFLDSPKHHPQGAISCHGLTIEESHGSAHRTSQEDGASPRGDAYEFVITDKTGRKLVCQSESKSVKLEWIDALERSATGYNDRHVVAVAVSQGGITLNMKNFRLPVLKDDKKRDYMAWILETEILSLSTEEKLVRYYLRCINMYSQIVLGRNQDALGLLINNPALSLSYDEIMHVLRGTALPHFLRARYFTLMGRLYVDRDPQIQSPTVLCTRVWSRVVPEESDLNMTSLPSGANIPVCSNGFVDLQLCLLHSIPLLADCTDQNGCPSLNADPLRGQLEMVQAQLQLASLLFDFGYFRDDVSAQSMLFESVFRLLDTRDHAGTSDYRGAKEHAHERSHRNVRSRLEASQDVLKRYEVWEGGLNFMLQLIELRLNYRISYCVEAWETVFESLRGRPDGLKILTHGHQGCGLVSQDLSSIARDMRSQTSALSVGPDQDAWTGLIHIFMEFDGFLMKLKDSLFFHNIISPPQIGSDVYKPGDLLDQTQQVLLSLCSFQHQPLTKASMALLIRNMSQQHALVSRLDAVQILVYPVLATCWDSD